MLDLIKGVVNVGVVLSLKPILKSWQLCLSFKRDVLTKAPTTERNIDHELLTASLILLYVCINNSIHIYLLCMIKVRVRWCSCSLWRML